MNFHSSPTSTLKAAMKCHVNGVSKEARPSPGSPARLPPPTTAGTRRPSTQRSGRLGAGGFPTGGDTRTQPAGRSLCPRLFPVTFFFKRTGHAADAAPSQPPRGRVTKEETQAGNGRARLFLRARAKRLPPCVQHAPPWVCAAAPAASPGAPALRDGPRPASSSPTGLPCAAGLPGSAPAQSVRWGPRRRASCRRMGSPVGCRELRGASQGGPTTRSRNHHSAPTAVPSLHPGWATPPGEKSRRGARLRLEEAQLGLHKLLVMIH